MKTLPKPAGLHLVGTIATELTDAKRTRHVASSDSGRRIFIKLWYPADRSASEHQQERLWEQLREEPNVPAIMKLLLRPAMRVLTNSHIGAPYNVQVGAPQILIYCHGLISFASENTMLMEHLASHGFVVISLQHLDQLAELRALQAAQTKEVKEEQARIEREIKSRQREERPELWGKYFRIASTTNRIVSGRSADIRHAASEIGTVLTKVPKIYDSAARIVGAIGLSLGGAVVTEFSKSPGSRLRCVVNLDGGNYGELQDEPVRTPYLMVYSEENKGTNDVALKAVSGVEVARRALPGTKHLNFHDISMVYPVMKWMRAIGSADPAFAIRWRNEVVNEFVCRAAA
jgi:hypothetical protein